MDNEVDKFFKDLPGEDTAEQDIFNEKQKPAVEEKPVPEKDEEPRKNRRHRRLEQQLQEEREMRIAAEARAEGRAQVEAKVEKAGVDPRLVRMYGTDEKGLEAAQVHMELLNDYATKGKEDALREIEEQRMRERQEQAQYESFIDTQLEALEDEHDVDLTSDAPAARKARRELLEQVQKLSPKDEDGTVTGYADFGESWEVLQLRRGSEKKPEVTTRQKELADRSMERGGAAPQQTRREAPPKNWNEIRQRLGL